MIFAFKDEQTFEHRAKSADTFIKQKHKHTGSGSSMYIAFAFAFALEKGYKSLELSKQISTLKTHIYSALKNNPFSTLKESPHHHHLNSHLYLQSRSMKSPSGNCDIPTLWLQQPLAPPPEKSNIHHNHKR